MKYLLVPLFFVTFLISCKNETKKVIVKKATIKSDTLKKDTAKSVNYHDEVMKTIPKNIKPVFGYRFVLSGDFDGDGKKENMVEHFISRRDNKETNKFYDSLNYDQLVALTVQKWPSSFVISDNKKIDTLRISSSLQLLGLSYLKNEGDLNGDGTDEVSYVGHWADWSNLNTWHIMTYKNKKWRELYSFNIWDWQLPDLPNTFNHRGFFGMRNLVTNIKNDTINQQIEREFLSFKGLVKKIKKNKIRVIYMNDEAMLDTMIVNLNKLPQKNQNEKS